MKQISKIWLPNLLLKPFERGLCGDTLSLRSVARPFDLFDLNADACARLKVLSHKGDRVITIDQQLYNVRHRACVPYEPALYLPHLGLVFGHINCPPNFPANFSAWPASAKQKTLK